MSKKVTRLYSQFIPENYDLSLEIDAEKMVFLGTVKITGKKTGRPSKRITFHQKDLKITEAKVTHYGKEQKEIKIDRVNTHKSYDDVRLHSSGLIYPGQYEIELAFEGKITNEMHGLYPCRYKKDGDDKIIFATQFESHHAREVFPCIDEPEAKATFDLKLITESGIEVLSNTEVKSQKTDNGLLVTDFEQTPVMSVYLLAFALGEIHCVEGKTKSGISVRSWAGTHQPKTSLQFANDEAIKILDFFEDYFKTPFPLRKCDQIALPDFDSAAMENWGLITYRETVILTDPANPSIPAQQYCSDVVAHELSHQWFGNLVTMKWWDDLWLNESFASLVPYIALEKLHPDWEFWEQYAVYDIIACSNRDIYSDVQAVGTDVKHPDEIGALFDPAIVYTKGGRLLKMLREYIGEDAFRNGLAEYFKQHAFKNTVRGDLWTAMSKASGKDIEGLMTPWLTQSGMPLVEVRSAGENQRLLTQSRFILDKKDDQQLWPIPLLRNDPASVEILNKKEQVVDISSEAFFNINGSGHYLVKYHEESDFNNLINILKNPASATAIKINTINDLILMSKRGDSSIVDSLKIIQEMPNEPRDAVWGIMGRAISLAQGIAEGEEDLKKQIKKMRVDLAKVNYKKLGWDDQKNEPINTTLLRASTISFMLGGEDETVIEQALKVYKNCNDISEIPADRRGMVLRTVVRHDQNEKEINKLIDIYKTTNDPDMQNAICGALTATKKPEIAKILIEDGLGEQGFVRNQDIFRWFAYLMGNEYTREQAWNWLTESWPRIIKDFGGSKSLDIFVRYSASPIQTTDWQKKFNLFFKDKEDIISIERYIKIAKAEIEARIAWRNRELKPLETFFKKI